jgi:tripartite ATP-independent transporter DctP family solute receptor
MKKRISIVLILALMLSLLVGCGGASEDKTGTAGTDSTNSTADTGQKKFIIAHSMATDTCFGALTDAFEKSLTDSGLFTVEVYPAAQLGSDTECIQNMQLGSISLYPTYSGTYSSYAPPCYIFDRMFSFKSKEIARAVYQDEDFLAVFDQEMQKSGIKVLGIGDMGFRQVTASRPLNTVADFKGLIIRTVENPILMAAWKSIGANPTPVQFTELYSALQQGVCEAQENPAEVTYSSKLYEQQKYIVDTNHIAHAIIFGMGIDYWNALTDEEKAAVETAAKAALEAEREATDANQSRDLKVFEDAGVQQINLSDDVRAELQSKMTDSWKLVEEKVSPELYDAYVSAIEKAEAANK